MFHFKDRDSHDKVHLIGVILILIAWTCFIVLRVAYIENIKKEIKNYEVISAEHFDADSNVQHLFVYGKLSTEKPIKYDGKDYALVRYITVKYDWDEEPHTFTTENGILYENDILENQNYNSFYDTHYGEDVSFGNLKLSDKELFAFRPYVIDSSWNDQTDEQKFVSVLNTNQNFIVYIDSVEYGSMSNIFVYQNMEEAREDLVPSLIGTILISLLVAVLIYLLFLMIIGFIFI